MSEDVCTYPVEGEADEDGWRLVRCDKPATNGDEDDPRCAEHDGVQWPW